MRSAKSAAKHAVMPGRATTKRKLHAEAGEVRLKIPKLRRQTFETAIIERYRGRESSVEEALIRMYLGRLGALCRGHHRGAVRHANLRMSTAS
jgi:transposase-like protein